MTAELESANNRMGILSQAIDDAKKAQKKAEQDLLHANREFRDEQVVVLHDQVQQLNASVEDAAAFGLAAKRDLEQSQARERLLRQELEKAVSEAHALREEVRGAHNDYALRLLNLSERHSAAESAAAANRRRATEADLPAQRHSHHSRRYTGKAYLAF